MPQEDRKLKWDILTKEWQKFITHADMDEMEVHQMDVSKSYKRKNFLLTMELG